MTPSQRRAAPPPPPCQRCVHLQVEPLKRAGAHAVPPLRARARYIVHKNMKSMLCHAPRSYRLTSGMRSSANHCAFSAGHVARGRGRVSGSSAALHTGATPIYLPHSVSEHTGTRLLWPCRYAVLVAVLAPKSGRECLLRPLLPEEPAGALTLLPLAPGIYEYTLSSDAGAAGPVSYTHLTLPTICSV